MSIKDGVKLGIGFVMALVLIVVSIPILFVVIGLTANYLLGA